MSARGVIADNAVWCSAHDDAGRYRDADMLLSALSGAGLVVEQDWQPIVTASRDELLDLLGAAMCFVEDAGSDPAYKAGYARRLARQMREAIEREDRKP